MSIQIAEIDCPFQVVGADRSTGHVGIGTTVPVGQIHVSAGFDRPFVIQDSRAGTNWSYIEFQKSDGSRDWDLGREVTTGNFALWSANKSASVFDVAPGGNVGIGTTSPSQSLDIVGNINLSGTIIQPGWTAVSYQNSWTDWAGGYAPAAYFKDKNGVVHLRGTMRSGTCFAAAFSLPAGYRPAYNIILAGSSNNAYSRLDITPTGAVLPGGCNGCGGTCNTGWYSVEGVTFMSEQ